MIGWEVHACNSLVNLTVHIRCVGEKVNMQAAKDEEIPNNIWERI